MGNYLVTAYWKPTSIDVHLVRELGNIAKGYGAGIDVDPNYTNYNYKPVMSKFSAEISGLWITWHGGADACMETMKKIKREWRTVLQKYGVIESEVENYFLPM